MKNGLQSFWTFLTSFVNYWQGVFKL